MLWRQNVAKSFAEHCGLLRVNERFLRLCKFSTANECLRNQLGHPSHPNPHPKKRSAAVRGPAMRLWHACRKNSAKVSANIFRWRASASRSWVACTHFLCGLCFPRDVTSLFCFFLWFCFLRNSMENGDDCIEWVLLWLNIQSICCIMLPHTKIVGVKVEGNHNHQRIFGMEQTVANCHGAPPTRLGQHGHRAAKFAARTAGIVMSLGLCLLKKCHKCPSFRPCQWFFLVFSAHARARYFWSWCRSNFWLGVFSRHKQPRISTSQSAVDGETLKKEMVKKPDDFHPWNLTSQWNVIIQIIGEWSTNGPFSVAMSNYQYQSVYAAGYFHVHRSYQEP